MPSQILDPSPKTARDYLKIIFRRSPILFLSVTTVTAVVFLGLMLQTPVYQAQVKMLISAKKIVESPYYRDLASNNNAEKITVTQSEIVKSSPVIERAVQALELQERPLDDEKQFATAVKKRLIEWQSRARTAKTTALNPEEQKNLRFRLAVEKLRKNIEGQPIRDTNTFVISVKDFSAERAAAIANAVSRSYVIFDLEQQLAEVQLKYGGKHPSVVQIRDSINKVFQRLDGKLIPNSEAIGPASVKIIEQASPPLHAKGLPKKSVLLMAFVFSLTLGIILAFITDYADPCLKSPEEISSLFQLPILGSLPRRISRRRAFVESLAHQILLKSRDGAKTFLIGSVDSSASSAFAVTEIGKFLSKSAQLRILLVDANFKKPLLQNIFKISINPGLKQVLAGNIEWVQAVKIVQDRLTVIPAGGVSTDPAWMDQSGWATLMEKLKNNFDLILISSDSLNQSEDAVVLTSWVDKTAIVVDECRTRREVAKAALQTLAPRKSELIGTIVNNRSFPIPKWIYDSI